MSTTALHLLQTADSFATMNDGLDMSLKEYLDRQFQAVERQLAGLSASASSHQNKNDNRHAELIDRLARAEAQIQAIEQTRPTIPQLLGAIAGAVGLTAGIVSIINMLI